jgi:putative peptidoglycan lipid II flippase
MNRAQLLASTLNTSVLRLIGQAIALVSGIVISSHFGANTITDDYYTALILPGAVANLIISSLTVVFTPIYLDYLQRDPANRRKIVGSMSFITSIALAIGLVICIAAVPASINLRDLQGQDDISRAITFGLLLTALTPMVGFARLLGVICEAHQRYALPAVAAVFNSVVFLLVFIVSLNAIGIYSLLLANLAGQLAELAILVIYTRQTLALSPLPKPFLHPAVREVLKLSIGPSISYLAIFFVPTFDRTVAATVGDGALTAFNFGERIVVVIDLLVTTGFITVIANHWANVAAQGGVTTAAVGFPNVLSLLAFAVMPLCLGAAMLSVPIISILFERGAFNAVAESAHVFAILAISLLFNYVIILMVRLLLIARDTRSQAFLSIAVSVLNALLNVALAPVLGLTGVVLSTLFTRFIVMGLSYWRLQRRLPQLDIRPALPRLARTIVCTGVMTIAILALQAILGDALARDYGLVTQIAALGLVVVVGAAVYIGVALLIRHPDFTTLLQTASETRYGAAVRRRIKT